ncbi:e3e992f2-66e5-4af7-917e-c7a13bf853d7 [Thermothielavioides terrestris]
MAIGL